MRFRHGDLDYSIDDSWWHEAKMNSWMQSGTSYGADVEEFKGRPVELVDIADVQPMTRTGSHGVFNDSVEFGTAHARVVRILSGFFQGAPIPPIELVALGRDLPCKYRLYDGVHRFYCSVAAGFIMVPAIVHDAQDVEL